MDNGHGENTPGKRSPVLPDGKQFFEYEFTRDIVRRIIEGCNALNIRTHNLVPGLLDTSLNQRVIDANRLSSDGLPKLYISVHSNAAGNGSAWLSASGIETFYYNQGTAGHRMAKIFQDKLVAATGWKNRGTKNRVRSKTGALVPLFVNKYTDMPAILTENGFYDNLEECQKLTQPEWRQKIADAHIEAMKQIDTNGL